MYPVPLTPGHRYIYMYIYAMISLVHTAANLRSRHEHRCVCVCLSNILTKRRTDAPPRRNTPRREPLALRDRAAAVSSARVQHSRREYWRTTASVYCRQAEWSDVQSSSHDVQAGRLAISQPKRTHNTGTPPQTIAATHRRDLLRIHCCSNGRQCVQSTVQSTNPQRDLWCCSSIGTRQCWSENVCRLDAAIRTSSETWNWQFCQRIRDCTQQKRQTHSCRLHNVFIVMSTLEKCAKTTMLL